MLPKEKQYQEVLKSSVPKCPEKFADVVSSLIQKSTPRKKALKRRCISSPSAKRKLDLLEDSCSTFKDTLRTSSTLITTKKDLNQVVITHLMKRNTSSLKMILTDCLIHQILFFLVDLGFTFNSNFKSVVDEYQIFHNLKFEIFTLLNMLNKALNYNQKFNCVIYCEIV